MRLLALWKSSAIRSAFGFALGGCGFALANVLLAKAMLPKEYGLVVLFVALTQLGATLGPAGMETVAIRHRLGASPALLVRVLMSATAFAGLVAILATVFFNVSTTFSFILVVAMVFAALNRMGCAFLQSLERYRRSLGLMMAHNGVLVAATLVLLVLHRSDVETVAVILAVGYGCTALYGWYIGRHHFAAEATDDSLGPLGREGFTILASQMSTAVLNQLDRILIPRVLSASALGHYAAVATLTASPFNLLQSGARHTLLPKLRNCTDYRAAMKHIRSEAVAALAIIGLAAAGSLFLAPVVGDWMFKGRYEFEMDLVQIIVGIGVLKVWHSFASGCIQALGTQRSLLMLSVASWGALCIAVGAAVSVEEAGLTSLVTGIGAGWVALCTASTLIALHAARTAFGAVTSADKSTKESLAQI